MPRIVSGGQTGVDRAAFDVARTLGLDYGGFVPKGRLDENGVIPGKYAGLIETGSANVAVRTRANVAQADATVVFVGSAPSPGTAKTLEFAVELEKPHLCLNLYRVGEAEVTERLREWLDRVSPEVLNVAGPRASEEPGLYAQVCRVLRTVLDK